MSKVIKAIKGMNDLLPQQTGYWQHVERLCSQLARQYGYQQVRFPILEHSHLFQRTVGIETDIVSKEMYSFEDRNGDFLSLRPEGTAGCVRAGIENGLLYNQLQRLWYMGPMFRRENPQKGRYRQFYQFGMEAFGMPGPEVEVEQILLIDRLWKELGIHQHITLEINNLGSYVCREKYKTALVAYFTEHKNRLDDEAVRRLDTNPLRILDSKNKDIYSLIENAPKLHDYVDEPSAHYFASLCKLLDEVKISYRVNPTLVRGLDYYNLGVYEWVSSDLGAQGTVCAGGRYDCLVEQLGGKATPAVGFALGLDRVMLLLQQHLNIQQEVDIYLVLCGEAAQAEGIKIAEALRDACPNKVIESHLISASFKSQFKRADKSGAKWALVLGDDEINHRHLTIKDLRCKGEQLTLTLAQFIEYLHKEELTND